MDGGGGGGGGLQNNHNEKNYINYVSLVFSTKMKKLNFKVEWTQTAIIKTTVNYIPDFFLFT